MVWLAGLITLLTIVLWVYAFFDALTCPSEEVRNLPKVLWMIIIIVFVVVGPLLWLFLGRPRAPATAATSAPVAAASADHLDPSDFQHPSGRQRPLGPDDDPEFLRRLDKRIDPEN
ncbi:PLDc N-terminal domain-containing protein [Actinorugispora endophytica]|uniref:Phospholipase D-like protein n=1 Tax=Actinorugispora endophytica TaxID=1605990 RepID=A0A4R6UQS9_9ACTN|nr:PLDc N-terminal domain-containing protein [Actinorugispora endophytica]TDQ45614.1 phospholipase D-like protein [Actinorugispora endophytica]